MGMIAKIAQIITVEYQLAGSILISLITSFLAFRQMDLDDKTRSTFAIFYLIMALLFVLFAIRDKLANQRTKHLLQFSFLMLGIVLMLTGLLGAVSGGGEMAFVFIFILLLPGLGIFRAGFHFKFREET